MKSSRNYLEEALSKMGDISDAKKAEQLKVSKQALSLYRSEQRVMDDFACIMVARVLGIDPLKVIAAANSEREKSKDRQGFWEDFRKQLGEKLGVAGLMGAMALMMMGTPTPAKANLISEDGNGVCHLHYVKSWQHGTAVQKGALRKITDVVCMQQSGTYGGFISDQDHAKTIPSRNLPHRTRRTRPGFCFLRPGRNHRRPR